jgi:hypothetical protein
MHFTHGVEGDDVAEDLQVRRETVQPSGDVKRPRDWGRIVKWTLFGLGVLLVFAFVAPPHIEGRIHSWYDDWQQTRYLKAHGIVTTPVASLQGPINGMTADARGNVYALAGAHHILTVLHRDGTHTTIRIPVAEAFGTAIVRGLGGDGAHGMVTLPDGTTFILDKWRYAIVRVAPDGSVDMNWLTLSGADIKRYATDWTNLSGDAAGNLYFVQWALDSSKKWQIGGIARISPDRTITWHWASLKQMKEVESALAVSPGGTVYAFGQGDDTPSDATDIFKVQSDHTIALVASSKPGPYSAKAPPELAVSGSNSAVSPTEELWFAGWGAVGTLLPHGKFASWWLTDAKGAATSAQAPLAMTSGGAAYAVSPNQKNGAAVQIVRFTLPTTN